MNSARDFLSQTYRYHLVDILWHKLQVGGVTGNMQTIVKSVFQQLCTLETLTHSSQDNWLAWSISMTVYMFCSFDINVNEAVNLHSSIASRCA